MTVEDPAAWHAVHRDGDLSAGDQRRRAHPPAARARPRREGPRGVARSIGEMGGARRTPNPPSLRGPAEPGRGATGHDTDGCLAPDPDADVLQVPGVPLPRYAGLQLGLPAGAALATTLDGATARCRLRRHGRSARVVRGACRRRAWASRCVSGYHTNFDRYMSHYACRLAARGGGAVPATLPQRDGGDAGGHRGAARAARPPRATRISASSGAASTRVSSRRHGARPRFGRRGGSRPATSPCCTWDAWPRRRTSRSPWKPTEPCSGPRRRTSSCGSSSSATGRSRAALQGAHPDVIFCGLQQGEALAAHYASGDVFLFPSETETFGNVTLEAMASGLAMVAYDYAAARAHLTHTENGLLVPYRNAGAFVEARHDACARRLARGASPPRARGRAHRGVAARGRSIRTIPAAGLRGPRGLPRRRPTRGGRVTMNVWLVVGLVLALTGAVVAGRRLAIVMRTWRAYAFAPLLLRRLSHWARAYHYADDAFFRADGAPEAWVARRRAGLERLGALFAARHPRSSAWGDVAPRELLGPALHRRQPRAVSVRALRPRALQPLRGGHGLRWAAAPEPRRGVDAGRERLLRRERGRRGPLQGVDGPRARRTCATPAWCSARCILSSPGTSSGSRRISGLDEVSFHMSGTEAVMAAVRLARFNTRRRLDRDLRGCLSRLVGRRAAGPRQRARRSATASR